MNANLMQDPYLIRRTAQDQALGVANRGSPGNPLAPPISRFLASTTADLVEIEPKRNRVQLR